MTNTLTNTVIPTPEAQSEEQRAAFVRKAAELLRPKSDLSNTLSRTQGPRPEVVIIPDPVIDAPRIEVSAERECPKCAEKIKARAKVCRFCGHDFEPEPDEREPEPEESDEDEESLGSRLRRRQKSSSRYQAVSVSGGPPPGWEYSVQPARGTWLWWLWLAAGIITLVVFMFQQHEKHERQRALRDAVEEFDREERAESEVERRRREAERLEQESIREQLDRKERAAGG